MQVLQLENFIARRVLDQIPCASPIFLILSHLTSQQQLIPAIMQIYMELNSSSHTRMWLLMMTSLAPFAELNLPQPPWWYLLNSPVPQNGLFNTMDTSVPIMEVTKQQSIFVWTATLNILKDHDNSTLMVSICIQWKPSVDLYLAHHIHLVRDLLVQSVLYNRIIFNTEISIKFMSYCDI